MTAEIHRIELSSPAYREMLRAYTVQRLGLSPEHNAGDRDLVEALLPAADYRFAYLAFLTERCERGKETRDSLRRGATGEALYDRWLQGLDLEYGRKLARWMRQVLAILGAAQQAHDWVFGDGRIEDPATGGALTGLDERFPGIGLPLLQTLLMLDRPWATRDDERYDPGLLFTLLQLQGVLAIHRGGQGESRFRIGLKAFGPRLLHDPELGPMARAAHGRMATVAMDAVEALGDDGDDAAQWGLFFELAPLLEAAVALAGDGLVAVRWGGLREGAVGLVERHEERLEERGYTLQRVPRLSQLAAWGLSGGDGDEEQRSSRLAGRLSDRGSARNAGGDFVGAVADDDVGIRILEGVRDRLLAERGDAAWSVPLHAGLAAMYQNRGLAHADGGDLAGAVADYDEGIGIHEGIRNRLLADGGEAAWSLPLPNDLAGIYQNRGMALVEGGDLAGAVADFDAGLGIREGIRDRLLADGGGDAAWSLPLRNDFADICQNRGIARANRGDLAGAVSDYDEGIGIREWVRDRLLADGGEAAWNLPLRNDLARIYQNRGLALADGGDLAGAVADCNVGVEIREEIRDRLLAEGGEAAWGLPLRNDLASIYQNRGLAFAVGGDLAGAVADYDTGIRIRERIRDRLLANGGEVAWSLPLRNDLAAIYQNRGAIRFQSGDLAGAVADYDAGIRIRERIRDRLLANGGEAAWSLPLRNDLAAIYQNRGGVRANGGDLAGAVADFDEGIGIHEGIRDRLLADEGETAWSLPLRNDLAGMHQNRGLARASGGDLAGAVADYDAGIGISEGSRDRLLADGGDPAWGVPLRNDLAHIYQNRGTARANGGDLAGAIADYDAGIRIREGIRDRLLADGGEAAWSLPLRNDLAAIYQNRGNARANGGNLAGAVADYDAGIGIGEGGRDRLLADGGETAWDLPLRNDLATMYQNRGLARANSGDLAGAVADYNAGIWIREVIRDRLLADGGEAAWSQPLRVDLAQIHCARAWSLGPKARHDDLASARRIATQLDALGHSDAAQSVTAMCKKVEQFWQQPGEAP